MSDNPNLPFRDPERVQKLAQALAHECTRTAEQPWCIMEVCGGQTHAIVRYGLDQLLPEGLELLHGPGCPVCVTPISVLDQAQELVRRGHLLCTFGDMLRVPGSHGDLRSLKAQGGDVRMVYSPLDTLALARQNPTREVIFLAVGFETTAPANAMAAWQARAEGLNNFSLLVCHVLVPPALELILNSPGQRVQAFLAAGHVCTVMGTAEYEALIQRHPVPIVVTGFEPVDLLSGLLQAVRQLEAGQARVENAYGRAVSREGNPHAQQKIQEVFVRGPQEWRGLGSIPDSGLSLAPAFATHDARQKFGLQLTADTPGDPRCHSGEVLQGLLKPHQCPAFGRECSPEHPLGAPMVSAEGACAAYYRYRGPHLNAASQEAKHV